MTISIATFFESYRSKVIPPNAPAVQVEECRRAFYAGSYVLLATLRDVIGADDVTEADGLDILEALERECAAFAAGVEAPAPPITPPDVNYTVPDPAGIQAILKELGGRIGATIPSGWGFSLLIFSYGPGGSMFYISSADRADVIAAMKEFINRQTQ